MKRRNSPSLSHVDAGGRVRMVDVGEKPVSDREAIARGTIRMSRRAIGQIRAGAVKKGDPLQAARLAGIMAAKQTSALIPLCHLAQAQDGWLTPDAMTDIAGLIGVTPTEVLGTATFYDMLHSEPVGGPQRLKPQERAAHDSGAAHVVFMAVRLSVRRDAGGDPGLGDCR